LSNASNEFSIDSPAPNQNKMKCFLGH